MKHLASLAVGAAAVMTLMAARPAVATPIYNNLDSVNAGYDNAAGDGGAGPLADSFSTGSSGYSLSQVGVKLIAFGTPLAGYTISIDLYSDNATLPGTPLTNIGSFDEGTLAQSLTDYYFTLATPYTLAASTRYWIMVSVGDGLVGWGYSYDQTALGVAGEYLFNSSSSTATAYPNTDGPYQMLVSDTPLTSVPEPGRPFTLVVAFSMLAGVWFARRRMRA